MSHSPNMLPTPDFRTLFESAPGRYLVLTPNLTIVAVSEAYLQATMTRREEILGRGLFEVLPDNPDNPHAPGVRNLRDSLDRVLQNRAPDTMPVQKYDIRRPESRGSGFEERYWSLVNSPVFGKDGEIEYILHRVEDVTEFVRLKQLEAEQHRLTEEITARKEAEWKLREFASLADNSPEFIGMCDMNLMPFYVNPAGMRLVGLDSVEQVRRTPIREFVFPEDQRFLVEEFFPRVLRDGRAEVEIRVRHFRTGESIWMLQNVFMIRDATGRPAGFATTGHNITERKQAEETLRASEERLRLAQEVARVGTFEWNLETGVNTWTPALEAMYGLPRGGFAGTQSAWENLVHPDDRAEAVRRVEQALETGAPTDGEWRVVWPDGSVHWLAGRWQVFKDASGRPLRMIGINIDITERKQAEETLRASEERLAYLASFPEHNPNPIVEADRDGCVRYANPAALRLFPDIRETRSAHPWLADWETIARPIRERRATTDIRVVTVSNRSFLQALLHLPGQGCVRVYGVDITERKQAEEALREMRLLPMRLVELRDQERKAIAQELRENVAQYLTAVNMYLHVMQNAGATSDPSVQRCLAEGIAGLKRCTSDVQALSHALHPPLLDHVGLAAAIEQYVQEFARRNDIRVSVEIPRDVERLPAEFELTLFRIMEEALTNVWRHSSSKTATVRVYCNALEVGLEVIDEGCGILSMEEQAIGRRAMGAGISEMRERASKLGGRVEIASDSHGTTVSAVLPYIREQSKVPPKN